MMKAISTQNLIKRFPRTSGYRDLMPFRKKRWVAAAQDINLEIEEGEFFGLLGPNGAGKTTLIKMLCCLILPTSGTARVFGHDVVKNEAEVKKLVGLVSSEERSFYWRLTGRENLRFYAALYHLPRAQAENRINELLAMLDLTEKADIRFQNYSTGMKQKMAIARGLLNDPQVLFVDEPTRSLDPVSARAVRKFFKERVAGEGKTVVLATHNLTEAEELCDRLAIIEGGGIKALGTVKELRSLFQKQEKCELEVRHLTPEVMPGLAEIKGVIDCRTVGRQNGTAHLLLRIADRGSVLPRVLGYLVRRDVEICDCRLKELPLDEIFVNAIGTGK